MKYLKQNKELLKKYLYILISNILIYILCNFYFKSSQYKEIIMMIITVLVDTIIYYYKGTKKFKPLLDILINIILGLILMIINKGNITYLYLLISFHFANNIAFMRSRFSEKFFKKIIQYIMIVIYTLISMFINILIYNIIF